MNHASEQRMRLLLVRGECVRFDRYGAPAEAPNTEPRRPAAGNALFERGGDRARRIEAALDGTLHLPRRKRRRKRAGAA